MDFNSAKDFRVALREDTIEYLNMNSEEIMLFDNGYYADLENRQELNFVDVYEMWNYYTEGNRENIICNAEFDVYRKFEYDMVLYKYIKPEMNVFVHGAGIGHEVMIALLHECTVDYYEPDINKKKFLNWRVEKYKDKIKYFPIDVTDSGINKEYDLIISFDVLEHVPAPLRTIGLLGEGLNDNGLMILMPAFTFIHAQHLEEHRWLNPFIFKRAMNSLGFELIEQLDTFYVYRKRYNNHPVWRL